MAIIDAEYSIGSSSGPWTTMANARRFVINGVAAGFAEFTTYNIWVRLIDDLAGPGPPELYVAKTSGNIQNLNPLTFADWQGYFSPEALALANGADVTSWATGEGTATAFATAGSDSTFPTFVTPCSQLNNKKAVLMDTSNDALTSTWNTPTNCSIFIVLHHINPNLDNWGQVFTSPNPSSGAPDWGVVMEGTGNLRFHQNNILTGVRSSSFGVTLVVRIEQRTAGTRTYANGVEITTISNNTTTATATVNLGYRPFWGPGVWGPCYLGFIGCTTGPLAQADAEALDAYFKSFYGVP